MPISQPREGPAAGSWKGNCYGASLGGLEGVKVPSCAGFLCELRQSCSLTSSQPGRTKSKGPRWWWWQGRAP